MNTNTETEQTSVNLVITHPINHPPFILMSIKTSQNKNVSVGTLISYRVGKNKNKRIAYVIQITASNMFVVAPVNPIYKQARYVGKIEYVDVRLALPETIVYQKIDGIEFKAV